MTRFRRLTALLAVFALVFVPATVEAKKKPKKKPVSETAGPPMDYTRIQGLSQPIYKKPPAFEALMLPMADGVEVYLEVTRPDAKGKFPVILEASPYHGTIYVRDGIRILPEVGGLVPYFVPRGYAIVMMDLRGTGKSQGCLDHLGPNDFSDVKEVIEWSADQPWSNGRVGITGHSYPGGASVLAAATHAEGLATAVPSAGLNQMYDHQFQGGVPYLLQWAGPQWAYEVLAIDRHLPPQLGSDPVQGGQTGDNFGNDMEYFGCGMQNSAFLAGESQLSGQYVEWHADRDFREGAATADIPIFMIHGTMDGAARAVAPALFVERDNPEDKLWLGQWDHGIGCCPNARSAQWTYALHAWFDKHLALRDVETGPPVEIFMHTGKVYTAKSWPVDGAQSLDLYANTDGSLSTTTDGAGSLSFQGAAASVSGSTPNFLEFTSEPVKQDMVLTGMPTLDLQASVTVPRVHLIANVFAVDKLGRRSRLTQFAINPELRNGIDTLTPVVPGERMALDPPAFAMGFHLRKGETLVLRISTTDPDKVPTFAFGPNTTIFTGEGGTVVHLPLIPKAKLYRDPIL